MKWKEGKKRLRDKVVECYQSYEYVQYYNYLEQFQSSMNEIH